VHVFSTWESFYVIVGSAAAALTGLQFVVMTLAADSPIRSDTIDAFGTPTIVHFCSALLVSATITAPWPGTTGAAVVLGAMAACGIGYAALVTRRARSQHDYEPVLEDWIWHMALPFAGYALLFAGAVMVPRDTSRALFAVAAAALLLLFIGIHNSWDTVTYLVIARSERRSAGTRTTAAENKSALEHAFRERATGNARPYLDLMSDTVRWRIMGTTQWSRTYAGKNAVMTELLGPLRTQMRAGLKITADRFIAEGDLVVVEAHGHDNETVSGGRYDNQYCWVYRFTDGRIEEMTEYLDTALVQTVLTPPEPR